MKVHEALKRASSFLQAHGRESHTAEILFRHHLGVTRTKWFQMMQDEMAENVIERLKKDVRLLADGVPVQYLTGREEFYGRPFHVNHDVLIPRPETEELVECVLGAADQYFAGEKKIHVIDVGTGSGAIAATLALENSRISVSAVDVSEKVLSVAGRNAERLGAAVSFYHGDLLALFIEQQLTVDIIVSNPPYIAETDTLQLDSVVRDHEPHLALFGGTDGLSVYRRLIEQIPAVLNNPGFIALEVGVGQSRQVASLIEDTFSGTATVLIKKDINGKERIVTAAVMR